MGNKAILLGIWVDWTLAILFTSFFVQQRVVPINYYFFVYILIRRDGVIGLNRFSATDFDASADILYIYNYYILECGMPYFG